MYKSFSTLKLYIPFFLNGINSCTIWSIILKLPPVTSGHLQVFACKHRTQSPCSRQTSGRVELVQGARELYARDWLWVRECVSNVFAFFLNNSMFTTVFVDTRLWKTKHLRKRFQNFLQSCVFLTDRIEIHQLQPLVWPSNLLYVMLSGCDWGISIRSEASLA